MTDKAKARKLGMCPECLNVFKVLKNGMLAYHAPKWLGAWGYGTGARIYGIRRLNHCEGSGKPPGRVMCGEENE